MPKSPTTVEVNILDKDYLVACPEDQQDALRRAARHLDNKMREIRTTGKVLGTERIAVMAALNITHELLDDNKVSGDADQLLRSMDEKLDTALGGSHEVTENDHSAG
ncbi:cell division protein ZapA [Marinobacter zhanjiangensis]|uniref:Cell division protein ZapA n=1 Tax=Marinobacter zhanjiangensis TaxID=578215 RepID=A0ABQ3B4S1_9GAMM|nr:cell division protein ZapA [Marinobacter zhanjiangensis]GGY73781.1 cell division protein ZapA [Marinobacter zhanjiangensis]